MATIYHQVGIKAPMADVLSALTTLEGLSSWWSRAEGGCNAGNALTFYFGEHAVKMQIEPTSQPSQIQWRCIAEDGEWKDTLFTFDLVDDEKQIKVNFTHSEWKEITEFFSHCSTKWATFLVSLKEYVETGTGKPFPNDIPINHS
jgi:hypothetical protein